MARVGAAEKTRSGCLSMTALCEVPHMHDGGLWVYFSDLSISAPG